VTTEKLPDYITAKREGNPTIVFTPALRMKKNIESKRKMRKEWKKGY
jgi:hypothetical protein